MNNKNVAIFFIPIIVTIAMMTMFVIILMPISVYAYTNYSQSEAVSWIKDRKKEGWAQDYDHDSITDVPQCVDLIAYYFDYLVGYQIGGNAYDYANRSDLPKGWIYTSNPSPGDIAVWKAWKGIAREWGHVALVESVGNGTFNYVDINGETGLGGSGTLSNSDPSTFIHPHFLEKASISLISPKTIHLNKGQKYHIEVNTTGNAGNVKWTSKTPKVASVSQKGIVKAKDLHMTTIIASYAGEKVKCRVYVHNPSLKLSKNKLTLKVGDTSKLKATVSGASQEVVWESSNSNVATVSADGVITTVESGEATISATANGITEKCTVKVKGDKGLSVEKINNAYLKYISSNLTYASLYPSAKYCFFDISNDGIDELIFRYVLYGRKFYIVLTYKNGKVYEAIRRVGPFCVYLNKEGICFYGHDGSSLDIFCFYILDGISLKNVAEYFWVDEGNGDGTIASYYLNSKKISKIQYDQAANEYMKWQQF